MTNLKSPVKILITNSGLALIFLLFSIILLNSTSSNGQSHAVLNYANTLKAIGKDPEQFVIDALLQSDLLIFDDAIHSAQEPFDFYQELLRDPRLNSKVKFVFIEIFSVAAQPHIDLFLASPSRDRNLLKPVFQNDFSGFGWRYETYLSLLETVWEVNQKLPNSEKIKVIGVDQPIFWKGINSRKDYDDFNHSLNARDYFMFLEISSHLKNFASQKKGIFLTNTRHAYTDLHASDGTLFWNCATFFRQRFPGKTLSIRLHNVSLSIEKNTDIKQKTIEGTDGVSYKWVKVDNGKWDSAFALNNHKPIGLPLTENSFGLTKYVGNQMLQSDADQTMNNAYDAVIFLAPLESLHLSATLDFFYDIDFKKELERRIEVIYGPDTSDFLKQNGCSNLEECINIIATRENKKKNTLGQ